ncbi:MAG: hypothetical protein HKL80_10760 [Acidimicrobiales bacterium]|nr:hypothetical protein [Acidimicrobiales bacterium]
MDSPAVLIEDENLRLDNVLKPIIGHTIKEVHYIIPHESVMPKCVGGEIHSDLDLGKFVFDEGRIYRFYELFSWAGSTFHTLALSPPNFYYLTRPLLNI